MKIDTAKQSYFTPKQRRAFRMLDVLIAALGIIASAIVLYGISIGTLYYGNRSEGDLGVFITLMIIVGVQIWTAITSLTLAAIEKQPSEARQLVFRPFWFQCTLASVLVIWFMALPWTFLHLGGDGPWLIWLFALPLMLALGMLFGALAWLFATVPLNMLVRGLYMAVMQRDKDAVAAIVLACMLLSMGLLIITMPMAVDTGGSGKGNMIAALIGAPGDYRVVNDGAYAVSRGAVIVAALTIVTWLVLPGRRKKATQHHVDTGFVEPLKVDSKKRAHKKDGR